MEETGVLDLNFEEEQVICSQYLMITQRTLTFRPTCYPILVSGLNQD